MTTAATAYALRDDMETAAPSALLDNTLTKLANRLAPTALLENTPSATPSEIMTRPAIAFALRDDTLMGTAAPHVLRGSTKIK
jgi:hypothetical protein